MKIIKLIMFLSIFVFIMTSVYGNELKVQADAEETSISFVQDNTVKTEMELNGPLSLKRFSFTNNANLPPALGAGGNKGAIIGGVVCTLLGLGFLGAGIPMWYLSGIGLGFITDHPGIIKVEPIDNNVPWLEIGYYAGIALSALGGILLAAGIVAIVVGVLVPGKGRVSMFTRNKFVSKKQEAVTDIGLRIRI